MIISDFVKDQDCGALVTNRVNQTFPVLIKSNNQCICCENFMVGHMLYPGQDTMA